MKINCTMKVERRLSTGIVHFTHIDRIQFMGFGSTMHIDRIQLMGFSDVMHTDCIQSMDFSDVMHIECAQSLTNCHVMPPDYNNLRPLHASSPRNVYNL
jgi:hypothetical protein